MIPAPACRIATAAALIAGLCAASLAPAPARADVMQIDADGARWVAEGAVLRSPDMVAADDADAQALVSLPPLSPEFAEAIVADPAALDAWVGARVPARYVARLREVAQRFDLSPVLLEALVWQESRWRETAISHAGARGLAQLMPGTARDLGVDPDDPMQNLEGGARYLREQLDRFDGDLEKALAAYNAGPGRVERADGIPNIRETRLYVAAIMGRLSDHARPPVTQLAAPSPAAPRPQASILVAP